jgi:hypothetical protein
LTRNLEISSESTKAYLTKKTTSLKYVAGILGGSTCSVRKNAIIRNVEIFDRDGTGSSVVLLEVPIVSSAFLSVAIAHLPLMKL